MTPKYKIGTLLSRGVLNHQDLGIIIDSAVTIHIQTDQRFMAYKIKLISDKNRRDRTKNWSLGNIKPAQFIFVGETEIEAYWTIHNEI